MKRQLYLKRFLSFGMVLILYSHPFVGAAIADIFGSGATSAIGHAASLRTVALSGQQAPGMPVGITFTYFESTAPMINDWDKPHSKRD